MKTNIHHIAISVTEFDRYVELFKNVFDMQVEKESGQVPHRKIWFLQGIQLNECSGYDRTGPCTGPAFYDHIGILAENQEELLNRALTYSCSRLPEGANWFSLPNGIRIELKQSCKKVL